MPFLIVVLAYLLSRYTHASQWLHHDKLYDRLLDKLAAGNPGTPLAFVISVTGTSLFTAWLFWNLPFWLHFFLAIAVLLSSTGSSNWRGYTANALSRIQQGNAESIWLSLEAKGLLEPDAGAHALWLALRKQAAYLYLTEWFAIFFWFTLFGPTGALFFRLLTLYNQHPRIRDGLLPSFAQWQVVMEWLPARYMGLCFCLSGNFATCFHVWRQLAIDTHTSNPNFLARCLDAALIVDDANAQVSHIGTGTIHPDTFRLGQALQDLLAHTEIIGLVGLALTVLVLH